MSCGSVCATSNCGCKTAGGSAGGRVERTGAVGGGE